MLFWATAGSAIGKYLAALALSVDIFDRTGLGTWLAALLIADFLPIVVIGITLGPLVDRLSRRWLIIASDLVPRGELRRPAVRRRRSRRSPARLGLGLVYKASFDKANRTPRRQARHGLAGALPVFAEIRETLGLPVVTDVHEAGQCARVAEVVDVLQIPAFLCRQTDLLIAAAKTGRVVKVKKGQFLAPWDMRNVVDKITGSGNPNVLVTERGASFGYNTLVVDMRSLPIMAQHRLPGDLRRHAFVQQPGGQGTASGGDRTFVPVLAARRWRWASPACSSRRTRIPTSAPSDGPNMVPLKKFEGLMRELMAIDAVVKGRAS